jgi:Ca2+-binding RTX toxin-like protein
VRKATLLTLLVALLVALTASMAMALNTINCPNRAGNVCVGTDGNDVMKGTGKADDMKGRAGNDTLRSFGAGDTLHGNIDNDTLYGHNGGDTVAGDTGNDRLYGRGGNDELFGGRDGDPDRIFCGNGSDRATIAVGDLVQTQSGDLVPVLTTTVEADLELLTTCERINIVVLQ